MGAWDHTQHTNIPHSPWLPASSNLACHVSSEENTLYLTLVIVENTLLPLTCTPLFTTSPGNIHWPYHPWTMSMWAIANHRNPLLWSWPHNHQGTWQMIGSWWPPCSPPNTQDPHTTSSQIPRFCAKHSHYSPSDESHHLEIRGSTPQTSKPHVLPPKPKIMSLALRHWV